MFSPKKINPTHIISGTQKGRFLLCIERGKHPLLVHNNIKNKMLHILVAMVRDRVKYNPDYVYRTNKEIV